jgi:hypothetical protein
MRLEVLALSLMTGVLAVLPAGAGEKADIDTSPRVFASANGKYWVRVTTKRDWGGDKWNWTTKMVVSHADGGRTGYADDKVVSETTLDTFPARMLVSDKGDLIVLGHFGGVSLEGVLTVYGPDGKKRGSADFMEFLAPLPAGGAGSPRQIGYERLRDGKGADFLYYSTDYLVIPLSERRVAKLSLATGRPAD